MQILRKAIVPAAVLVPLVALVVWKARFTAKSRAAEAPPPSSLRHERRASASAEPSPRTNAAVRAVNLRDISTEDLWKRFTPRPRVPGWKPPTNWYDGPPELRGYAEHLIVSEANRLNNAFKFHVSSAGVPKAIALDDLIVSQGQAKVGGFAMSASLKNDPDGRYSFHLEWNQVELFTDWNFDKSWIQEDPLKVEALRRATNHLTTASVIALTKEALAVLGLPDAVTRQWGGPEVIQRRIELANGGLVPAPYYSVTYYHPVPPGEHMDPPFTAAAFEILGVEPQGRVVAYQQSLTPNKPPLPEGYSQIWSNWTAGKK